MKIIQLRAENFKRIKAVDITPTDDVVLISGANEQGKSSVLDAIWAALNENAMNKGTGTEQPIHSGADKAEVSLNLGEFIIKRRWTKSGSTLTVVGANGTKFAGPQAIINKFMSDFTVDPIALTLMKPQELKDFLLKFVAFDWPKYQADRKVIYDARTDANRDLDTKTKLMNSKDPMVLKIPGDTPAEEISVSEIMGKIKLAQSALNENNLVRDELKDAKAQVVLAESGVKKVNDELARLHKAIEDQNALYLAARHILNESNETLAAAQEMVAALVDPDPSELEKSLASVETINRNVRSLKEYKALATSVDQAGKVVEDLKKKLADIDVTKDEAFKKTKLPVEGLTITEDSVMFKGIPFVQCSSEEKLRVSVGLAMMTNPGLKVLRIKDGSLLDKKHMAILQEMIRANGFQAWIEIVDESGDVGFCVEDGQIVTKKEAKP